MKSERLMVKGLKVSKSRSLEVLKQGEWWPSRLTYVVLFFTFHFSLFTLTSCARQGYPSGGPKDTAPPVVLECTPQNEGRDFDAKEFYIHFDEYVVLKNADNNVIISPPMKQKPEFSVKGKSVRVKIKDTLQTNATYLFQFKEAIADFTEGNLLPSFEYVFSTGSAMDTMMMAGRVLDARTGKPWKETLTVLAYRDDDSVPAFVTRCDKDGNFAFHYIAAGSYRLVSLEDKNRDMKVGNDEPVAWLDELVTAMDTVDSTHTVSMRLSVPDMRRQRVLNSSMPAKGRIRIVTAQPMQHPTVSGEQVVQHLNAKGDTLTLWCVNPTCDSTVIVLSDEGLQDTLRVRYIRPRRGRGVAAAAAADEPLMRSLCSPQNTYYDELWLGFTNPIVRQADGAQAEVKAMKDSSVTHCSMTLDSTGLRARINATLKPDNDYRIRIPAAAFTDLYGNTTDTLLFALKPKDYAILTVHIDNRVGSPLVVELLDSKDSAIVSRPLKGSGNVRFDHIAGGNYRLRVVVDADGDGSWTTGSYPLRRQPEDFIYFDKPLQLRERWEMEEKWTVER